MTKHMVSVVQAGSSLFDTPRTLERMQAHCEEAAKQHVQLVVFPEAYVGGYPKGMDFGARVGSRTPEGRDEFLRYWQSSIEIPGPECLQISDFAAAMSSYLVTGVVERDGGTLYCTNLLFGPEGQLLAKHRKLQPTASERLIWGQGDGSTLPVIDTELGKITTAICWEHYMLGLRQALYAKGASIWCGSTVDDREIWQSSMRHIAYEGRMFLLSSCQYFTSDDAPEGYLGTQKGDKKELIKGGSVIINPFGEILAGPLRGREGVLTAEIDVEDTIRGKYDLDVVGHYARPDVFHLTVDESSRNAVTFQNWSLQEEIEDEDDYVTEE